MRSFRSSLFIRTPVAGRRTLFPAPYKGSFHFSRTLFTFRYLLAFILGLFLLRAVMITLSGYIRGRIGADFMGTESEGMLKRMLRASWPFLLKQKIGTLQATLVRDIQRTENLLSVFGQIIQSFSGLFIYLLVALNISPVMTLCTLVVGVGASAHRTAPYGANTVNRRPDL